MSAMLLVYCCDLSISPPHDVSLSGGAPARIYNVGNNHPEELGHLVEVLEKELGRTAVKDMLPMQPGDVTETFADVADLMRDTGFRPQTSIEDGHSRFCRLVSRPLQSLRRR